MPKRKRDEAQSPDNDTISRHTGAQRKRVEEKLFHAQKILQRALKVAKGFERQKLGRRQKTATKEKDEPTLKRLDAEIEALKTLDLGLTAEAHLHKTLSKDKAISQSSALPQQVIASTKPALDTATANVTARLYNSNPVKEAFAEALANIRLALGLPSASRQPKKAGSNAESATTKKSTIQNTRVTVGSEDVSGDSEVDSGDEHDEEGGEEVASGSEASAVDDENDFAAFDSRLADPSDEDSSLGSEAEKEDDTLILPNRTKTTYKPDIDMSLSPSPSISRSASPVSKIKAIKKKPASSGPSASKTYLPSLTMGGYYSDSNSEAEDLSDADVAPRKNRRGQRARQQIWEKKYGQKAKHLHTDGKSESKKGTSGRDDGWDLKRGAQQAVTGRGGKYQPAWKKARGNEKAGGTGGFASGGNATQVAPRKPKVDTSNKPLHPSWEAAKRAKEKKADVGAFAGKKVVFD